MHHARVPKTSKEKFFNAVQYGDIATVRDLLREGSVNIEDTDATGRTALYLAAMESKPEMVACLIKCEANCNVKNNRGTLLAVEAVKAVKDCETAKYREYRPYAERCLRLILVELQGQYHTPGAISPLDAELLKPWYEKFGLSWDGSLVERGAEALVFCALPITPLAGGAAASSASRVSGIFTPPTAASGSKDGRHAPLLNAEGLFPQIGGARVSGISRVSRLFMPSAPPASGGEDGRLTPLLKAAGLLDNVPAFAPLSDIHPLAAAPVQATLAGAAAKADIKAPGISFSL